MKMRNKPRFVLAGSNSGCGKTTLTCGLLKALMNRGLSVASFKCGPDYLDPMLHNRITGRQASNLDLFLLSPEVMRYLAAENSKAADIAVIEGVMGLYDGWGLDCDIYSTNQVALELKAPEILVLNGRGRGFSLMADLYGYLNFRPNNIKGVIINQITEAGFELFGQFIELHFGVKALGYLENSAALTIGSRHLGLQMDWEIDQFDDKIEALAAGLERTVDIDALLKIAKAADDFEVDDELGIFDFKADLKIGIAKDRAFCFHYHDNFKLLERLGVEIIFFSPLNDASPPQVDALIFGGGYPELFAKELSGNKSMVDALRRLIGSGLPVLAECGGLIYLSQSLEGEDGLVHEMLGCLPGQAKYEKKLRNFGYVELRALEDNLLCRRGETVRAHEFHYFHHDRPGETFLATKKNKMTWKSGYATNTIYAGYPHFNFWGKPEMLINFLKICKGIYRP